MIGRNFIICHWQSLCTAASTTDKYLPLAPCKGAVKEFNPHPVMSPDLRGPPAGPRRPGTMIFKCVELLVQLKNNNSSYWLLHITSALNCKILLIFLASILCHVRNMIKKYIVENVTKIYISPINENRFFATFMHVVIKTMCMMDLFDIPLCDKKNLDTCIFFIIFLGK